MADGQMTPADFAAMTGGMDGQNGSWWCFLLIILFFICGFGGNGAWGGRPAPQGSSVLDSTLAAAGAQGGFVTQSDLDSTVRMQSLQQGQRDITETVNGNKYDLANAINATEARLTSSVSDLRANQQANAQAQQACCNDLKYASAMNTSSVNENVTAASQRVLDALAQDKADRQAQRINDLQQQLNAAQYQNALNAATFGTVKYPTTSAYSSGANPFCQCGQCCA